MALFHIYSSSLVFLLYYSLPSRIHPAVLTFPPSNYNSSRPFVLSSLFLRSVLFLRDSQSRPLLNGHRDKMYFNLRAQASVQFSLTPFVVHWVASITSVTAVLLQIYMPPQASQHQQKHKGNSNTTQYFIDPHCIFKENGS